MFKWKRSLFDMQPQIAWRSLRRNLRRTAITVSAVSLGLAFAVFYTAMHAGVNKQLIEQGIRFYGGHIILEHPQYRHAPSVDLFIADAEKLMSKIQKSSSSISASRTIINYGMARTAYASDGILIKGIEPTSNGESPFSKLIVSGRFIDRERGSNICMGKKLSELLRLGVGQKFVLTTNDITGTLTEGLCRVEGIFETGIEEIDSRLVLAPIGYLEDLLMMPSGGANQIAVLLDDPGKQSKVIRQISTLLADESINLYSWKEVLPELASYLRVDQAANLIFQGILFFIILFTIFNTILMSVNERNREFAVLLAVGTPPLRLRWQLLLEAFYIGIAGCLIGLIIGGMVSYIFQIKGLNASFVYGNEMSISGLSVSPLIHAHVTWDLLAGLGGAMLVLVVLVSFVPMLRISRISLMETLR